MSVPNPSISFVTLGVLDLERSRRFYAAIGLREHARSNPAVAFFDLGGQVLALYPRSALAEDVGVTATGADAGIAMALARNVGTESEVQGLLDRAAAAGGRITRMPSAPAWGGVRGYFADPDGFAWEVAWNPDMPVDADGRIRFTDP